MENIATIRKSILEGYPVYVIDDFLEAHDVAHFFDQAVELPFTRAEKDFDGDQYPIFSYDFDPNEFEAEYSIGQRAKRLIGDFFPEDTVAIFRAYINMSHYGDVEFPHRDCDIGKKNITFLYYMNKEWDYRWGGETKFYEGGDPRILILPKPGRCAVFRGAVEHMGSIPTRICTKPRLT